MATQKKYVSLEKLGLYDEKIKKVISDGDAAKLAEAKAYADGLADNYDAAGSAATAKSEAVAYTDTEIGKVNTTVDGVKTIAEQGVADAATADSKAVAAQEAADNAQSDVDTLAEYVGTIPESATATDVIGYIDEKTSGIATDAALAELQSKVTQTEKDIDALEGLVGTTAVTTQIANAVQVETDRATEVESDFETRIKAIEDDYLVAADKESLQQQITTNANAIATLTDGVDAEKVDGVKDLIQYVEEHGAEVTGIKADIEANADAISAEITRATGVEAGLQTAVEKAQEDATKASTDLAAEIERATGAEGDLDDRLKAVEGAVGESGSVAEDIATAKQEAIDAAASDATTKANTAETNAKGYADGLDAAMNTRVEALEAIDHDHANKAELDLIAAGDKAKWDAAEVKAHEHANKTVLDGIDATKIATWDAAEGNAKTYADGLNTAMDTRVAAVELWQTNMVECSQEDIQNLFI